MFGLRQGEPIPYIEVSDAEEGVRPALRAMTLSDYERVSIEMDEIPVASFCQYQRGVFLMPRVPRFPPRVPALLAIPLAGRPLVEALFLPLQNEPPIQAYVDENGARRPLRISTLTKMDEAPRLFAQLNLCSRDALPNFFPAGAPVVCQVRSAWSPVPLGRKATVVVDGQPMLIAAAGPDGIELWPTERYYRVCPASGGKAPFERLVGKGMLRLVLHRPDGEPDVVPLGTWRRQDRPFVPDRPLTLPSRTGPRLALPDVLSTP